MKNDVPKELGLRPDQAGGQNAQVDASVKEKGLEPNKSKKEYEDIKPRWLLKHIMDSIIIKSYVT